MMGVVGISWIALASIGLAVAIGLAFTGALIFNAMRGKEQKPDIPAAMRPGPADETLERRKVESVPGWALFFVLFFAVWLPIVWINEPGVNQADEVRFVENSVERGGRWFQISSETNPTGFGCARCHGAKAEGGTVAFTPPEGDPVPAYPVPPLNNVCGRLEIEGRGQIRETIMQGRQPNTPMPSWSVRFQGPMNDEQIQDLINYIVSIQKVPFEENQCTNPKAAAAAKAAKA